MFRVIRMMNSAGPGATGVKKRMRECERERERETEREREREGGERGGRERKRAIEIWCGGYRERGSKGHEKRVQRERERHGEKERERERERDREEKLYIYAGVLFPCLVFNGADDQRVVMYTQQ